MEQAVDVVLMAQVLGAAMAAVAIGMMVLALLPGHALPARDRPLVTEDTRHEAVFIFDGETLIDCSPEARAILAASPGRGTPWVKLSGWLGRVFPAAEDRLAGLRKAGRFTLASADYAPQALVLHAELRGGLTRITVSDAADAGKAKGAPVSVAILTDEVDALREMAMHAPWLCWRERPDGSVVWANAAYLMKLEDVLSDQDRIGWPLPRLFAADGQSIRTTPRQPLPRRDGRKEWFDMTVIDSGSSRLVFGLPVDQTVRAEMALRDMVQNLTRAFSHVPVGIAVFDPQRRLNMFNPALLDLTGLPAELLSARPTLISLLDAMRDRNMLPEPRDYRSWRRKLAGMENASSSGQFEEDWTLPGGQTYRILGRPQPDGSLVLMLNDISTEVTRVQRYRADLELGQAVIDAVDDAIAVFAPTGQLAMSNAAYGRLWGHDHGEGLESATVADLAAFWQSRAIPSTLWRRIADFVTRDDDTPAWEDMTRMTDGRLLFCEVKPLSGGATMATFRLREDLTATFSPVKRRA